jgi:L-ascorbate metabolism protein UlaG (beta-lactamase superfamily)
MKIKHLAHAAFLITADSGVRIVTDPYETSPAFKHDEINESADIVTVSHEHGDHNNVAAVGGNPQVVKTATEARGINITAVATAHDDKNGSERGRNTVFCFEIEGMNVCHLGDLGHMLNDAQAEAIGSVDVLMVPVGGFFTIDAGTAGKVSEKLKAKVIIPMHYNTEKMSFPIKGVDDFLEGKDNVTREYVSETEIKADSLPVSPQIIVLEPAL